MLFPEIPGGNWLRLSHVLTASTPAYGGGAGLVVGPTRMMSSGDSCNAVSLSFPNHLGSHVDAPRHFVANGRTVDSYGAGEWVFTQPVLLDIPAEPGEILTTTRFAAALGEHNDGDLLLVRTGFENRREEDVYWAESPAFAADLADFLRGRLPSLSAIGFDTISLSSYRHRDLGRSAHRAFLGAGLRVFEDLALAVVPSHAALEAVVALPLLFDNADGAPCTVIGRISE